MNYRIPDTATKIEAAFFKNNTELKSVLIPSTVTVIGDEAFMGCTNLESIIIPDSVSKIGDGAFRDCTSLKYVAMPILGPSKTQGVIIERRAFLNCSNLETVIFPDTLGIIGDCSFFGCTSLKTFVTYPTDSFGNSTYVTGGAVEGLAFFRCINLETVILSDPISYIKGSAFWECKKLHTIKLPNYLYSIGERAFRGCESLNAIELPDSVYSVGVDAFMKCPALKTIKCSNAYVLDGARLRKGITII